MAALFLAPFYLAVCFYVLNWMLKWMAVCNNIFALAAFRYGFSALYILTATTLLSSFLIKKPDGLHRTLKHISNLWLGTFLYALIGIGIADFIRILLYFSPLADASWFHSKLMFAATGFFTGVLILFFSFYGFFHAKKGRAFVAPALPFTFCRSRQKFLCIHLHRNNESDIRRMLDPPQRVE